MLRACCPCPPPLPPVTYPLLAALACTFLDTQASLHHLLGQPPGGLWDLPRAPRAKQAPNRCPADRVSGLHHQQKKEKKLFSPPKPYSAGAPPLPLLLPATSFHAGSNTAAAGSWVRREPGGRPQLSLCTVCFAQAASPCPLDPSPDP